MLDKKVTILYVDDEEANLELFRILFEDDFVIHTSESVEEALEVLESHLTEIEVLITDHRMPGMTGLDLLKIIKKKYPDWSSVKVMLSGYADTAFQSQEEGQYDLDLFITKPYDEDALKASIYHCLDKLLSKA